MKKLLALLTLAALLMTAFVCPTLAESPMTSGGWRTQDRRPDRNSGRSAGRAERGA